jgi:hypothetical protein
MKIELIEMINGKDTISSFTEKVNKKLEELGKAVLSVQWISSEKTGVTVNFVVISIYG